MSRLRLTAGVFGAFAAWATNIPTVAAAGPVDDTIGEAAEDRPTYMRRAIRSRERFRKGDQ